MDFIDYFIIIDFSANIKEQPGSVPSIDRDGLSFTSFFQGTVSGSGASLSINLIKLRLTE